MTNEVPAHEDVPRELLEYEQWICWRTQNRNGKPTKVPINPKTSQFASVDNPDSWTTFETARDRASEFGGLGFVFTEDDPLVGVDLDDCRDPETGSPADWAKDVIDTLGSFTEISPSGTGYHVLLEGELPGDRNRKDGLEVYESGRFFTVTGEHVAGTPKTIDQRTDSLETVYDSYLQADDSDEASTDSIPEETSLSDDALLEKAKNAANGAAFAQLYRGSTGGYESHSEADMALCSHLAFWTGGDATQMDRLFRDSGLMREKWDDQHFADGSTYGEKTIERAIAGTQEFYEPGGDGDDASTDRRDDDEQSVSQSSEPTTVQASGSTSGHAADTDDSEQPALRERELERMERIDELETQLRSVIDEKEALEAELEAEREQRRGLEAELEATGETDSLLVPW